MQSTHPIIFQHPDDGKLRCRAREIGPGTLMVQFFCYDLAQSFQDAGHEYAHAWSDENDDCLLIFFVTGKSLKWFRYWLDRNTHSLPPTQLKREQ